MSDAPAVPPWTVALVCGASGVGKSTVATALAARYGVPLTAVDDLVIAVSTLTTPEQQPVLHYWETQPATRLWSPDELITLHLQVAEVLRPAVRAVILDHLEFAAPVIIEGDYLLPDLVDGLDGVRAVVLDEPEADQIVAGFLAREPGTGPQPFRAQVSVELGQQLVERAGRVGVPVVAARPWADVTMRADAALRTG